MLRIAAAPVKASSTSWARAIDRVADVVEYKPLGYRSVAPLPSVDVSPDLKAGANAELSVALDEVVGPWPASRLNVDCPLGVETFVSSASTLVLDRHIEPAFSVSFVVTSAVSPPARLELSVASVESAGVHGT